jgi:DNA-binding transcriptional ArsR family regulator/anti-sigma regulatory factor (Ser/Thr protein kinase)
VTHTFYPFVDNDPDGGENIRAAEEASSHVSMPKLPVEKVDFPARIAIYDDAAAAPRVVIVDPQDVRSYLEEITKQVTQLSHEQGGTIPFTVIREIVENFIHAYFIEPTISILDSGNTIRFSDQGPGIKEKKRALEYGTSSATEEMKRYIRGVGSGLPYVQQYMQDKGGSLTVEDNISQGTIVTISTKPHTDTAEPEAQAPQAPYMGYAPNVQPGFSQAPVQNAQQGFQQGYPPQPTYPQNNVGSYPQGWQATLVQPSTQFPIQSPTQPTAQEYSQGYLTGNSQPFMPAYPQQNANPAAPTDTQQAMSAAAAGVSRPEAQDPFSWIALSPRGQAALRYLGQFGVVGPSDLQRAFGESQPTWTRELKQLEEAGLIKKEGQKRRLTGMGQAYLAQHPLT